MSERDAKVQPNSAGKPGTNAASTADGSQQTEDAAATVLEDLESLRARALERDQFLELLKRTQADFENYQKRNQRERDQEYRYRNEAMARDLLQVLDNLERAVEAAKQANEKGPLVQGVGMVMTQFLDLLKRHGITPIEAQGQPFDPHLHQAVMQQPSKELPPHSVAQVFQRGFMIHDRVLRPASVAVAVPGNIQEDGQRPGA
jgi:molecular chaperone GrpE